MCFVHTCVQWTCFIQVLEGLTELLTILQCSLKRCTLTPKIYSLRNIFPNGLPIFAPNQPSFVPVGVSVLGLGLTNRSQPIRSLACSADATDVELVSQQGSWNVIHSYVWGPAQMTTFGGCCYYVMFIDDYSKHIWIYPMWQKSEVFSHFQKFKDEVQKATNHYVLCLRSDGGKEYFFKAFNIPLTQRNPEGV